MRVSRARISGSMLSRLGARWVTMTKAMPGSGGMALNKYSSASTPPAEAPTPTMGNGSSIGSPQQGSRGNASACGGRLAPRLRQGPVNSKSLCRPCNAIGWFGTRQKALRLIDRGPCRFDLFLQLRNLATGRLDQRPGLGHDVAMLGVNGIRSVPRIRSHVIRAASQYGRHAPALVPSQRLERGGRG